MNEEIKMFLQEGKSKGFSLEELKQHLISSGWSKETIEKEIQTTNNLEKNKKERPIGIKITTYIHYIAIPLLMILSSIIQILTQKNELTIISSFFPNPDGIANGLIFAYILLPIIFSIIPIVVGFNLWKGKNGDRIFAIVLGFLFLLTNIFAIFQSIYSALWVIISVTVIWFLLIDKKTIEWFKKK